MRQDKHGKLPNYRISCKRRLVCEGRGATFEVLLYSLSFHTVQTLLI
ncbi:MAG: hypothetical protein ACK4FM_00340 [Caldimicrobium sp.]